MRRFFLVLCAIVALMVLATTAAFAGSGRSGAAPGKALQASHGKSDAADAGTHGATAKVTASTHGAAATHAQNGSSVAQNEDAGKSAEAQHHVILCHRTGSDTNPYVVINVSVRAWDHGHSTHPAKDGRSDILLKDPAEPGEKMDESLCPTVAGVPGGTTTEETGGTTTGEAGGTTTGEAGGGVAGTTASGTVPQSGGGAGGVLGSAARQNLPFTGLPVWIVALAGAGLLTAGIVVRRAAGSTSR